MVMTRLGSPTWMAASPMPGASYMVSNMSSTSLRMPASIFFTGSETSRNRLSGRMRMSRNAMTADVSGGPKPVNPDVSSGAVNGVPRHH
jgi:hypothetical protein